MNGLAGIVYPDVFQMAQFIQPMVETLAYEKLSQCYYYSYKNFQFGSAGSTFATNEKRNIYAALNGWILNEKELRSELKTAGFSFSTQHPAQVLIYAYEHWGIDFLNKIDGSFVIVLFDQELDKIILARDRIGKKTMYWQQSQKYFVFASEIKSLLATGVVAQEPDVESLSYYLYFGYIPQDMSPIKNVNKLLPGHYLEFSRQGSVIVKSYWSYSSFFNQRVSYNEWGVSQKLEELSYQFLKHSLPAQDPVGCFVSGGIGSAATAYYLRQSIVPQRLKAFSVGFQGQNPEDILAAEQVCQSLHINQDLTWITSDNFLDDFTNIVWALDEPCADPNVIATSKLCSMAGQHVKYVYSGMGSDELLAGHSRYSTEERRVNPLKSFSQNLSHFFNFYLTRLLQKVTAITPFELLRKTKYYPWQFNYLESYAIFNERTLKRASPRLAKMFEPDFLINKFYNLKNIDSAVSSLIYLDVKTRLVDQFIFQYERLSSLHGLQWDSPFLNRKTIEYLASLTKANWLDETQTAAVLKAQLKNVYSSTFLQRPKRTRRNFLASWVDSPSIVSLLKHLPNGVLVDNKLISKSWLEQQLASTQSRYESFYLLWSLFTLETWYRLFIEKSISSVPPKDNVFELYQKKRY